MQLAPRKRNGHADHAFSDFRRRKAHRTLSTLAKAAAAACLVIVPLAGMGCADAGPEGFIAPQELGRETRRPLKVMILTSLGAGLDVTAQNFSNATSVTPADLQPIKGDYVIGRDDLLQISITDLAGPGIESLKQARVTESGNITLPYLNSIKAAGLSEAQLQDEIAGAYQKAGLIARAQVSVTVMEARARVFSILGAIARPGQYSIINNNFRILDAMVLAGDVNQTGIEYMYVIRPGAEGAPTTQPGGPSMTPPAQPSGTPAGPANDPFAPHSQAPVNSGARIVRSASASAQRTSANAGAMDAATLPTAAATQPTDQTLNTVGDDRTHTLYVGGAGTKPTTWTTASQPATSAVTGTAPANIPSGGTPTGNVPAGNINVPVVNLPGSGMPATGEAPPIAPQPSGTAVLTPPEAQLPPTTTPFTGFTPAEPNNSARIIRIPLQKLQHGDLRYNIVIHPNDTLIIPVPEIARYYMGGHVLRTGVYDMTNQRITLKQAVISAGMLDELAIPQRTDLIRRIDKDQEVFVRVDLAKVFSGTQPDIYLKPNDEIMVGTNIAAPFIAAVRDSFRITYGFGFLYDRNYADYGPGANTGQ